MRAIIHIGSPKTGTSALQAALLDSEDILCRAGHLYPETGRKIGGKNLTRQVGLRMAFEPPETKPTGMMGGLGLVNEEQRKKYAGFFQQQLSEELGRAKDFNTVIFSDEALFSFSNPRMIKAIYEYSEKNFDEVEIVIFIKDPIRFVAGSYSQHIKMGNTRPWPIFLSKRMERPIYAHAIKIWIDFFGRDRVRVAIQTSNILSQFKTVAGLPFDLRPSSRGRNASLSRIGLPVLRYVNAHFKELKEPRPAFIRAAFEAATAKTSWSLPIEDAVAVAAWFEAERERLICLADFSEMDIALMRSWSEPVMGYMSDGIETEMRQNDVEEIGDLVLEVMRKADKRE